MVQKKHHMVIVRGYTNEQNFKAGVPAIEGKMRNYDDVVRKFMVDNNLISSRDYPHVTIQYK